MTFLSRNEANMIGLRAGNVFKERENIPKVTSQTG